MINIKTIFINHFASVEITDDRLKAFTLAHINKLTAWLTAHTDPEISALRAAIVTNYNAYFGAITDEGAKLAIQQGLTIASNNAWTAVLDFIRQHEGTVKGLWGKDSVQYQQFYPQGLDEYNHATKLNKDTLLGRYLYVATIYAISLPMNFVTDFTNLKNDWTTKYTAQQEQIGLVKDADSQTANTREPLEVQLSLNMLIIGSKNIGYPDRVGDFFTQSIIRRKTDSFPANSVEIRGKVSAGAIPIVGAEVIFHIDGPVTETVFTDSDGEFEMRINDIPATNPDEGNVLMTIDVQGYQHYEQMVHFKKGTITTAIVKLSQGLMKAA